MKILLISDNHAWHDDALLKYAQQADEVWHAGDWLNLDLFYELEKLKKTVRSCWGNVDGHEIRAIFPEHNQFQIQGIQFWMTHIAGHPGKYNPKLLPALRAHTPNVLICGHSHILRIARDEKMQNMLYMNPGSCGIQGFHHIRTAIQFQINTGKIEQVSVIEFGPRTIRL